MTVLACLMMFLSKIVVVILLTSKVCICQIKNAQDPVNANAGTTVFFFDSNSDCNGPIRELYGFEGTIRGNDITATRLGPPVCRIRLQSSSQFAGTVLDIEVKSMNIEDKGTKVTIYDGDGEGLSLMSYDSTSNRIPSKRRFSTTGDIGTFVMERININSVNFDIEIKINPIRGGTVPGYENSFGSGYFFDKFPQTTIVGLIAGFYGLIIIICIIIFFIYCCKYRKMNKKWEVQQLATIKKGAVFDNKSQPSYAWSIEMKQSKGPASVNSVSVAEPRSRKTAARNEDADSDVMYNVDGLQNKRLVSEVKSKGRPMYTSSNASFTEADDDSDHFVEKIITPSVKPGKKKGKLPPSYEDAISDRSSEYSTEEESDDSSSQNSVGKKPASSDEERSSNLQSESASDSDGSSQARAARTHRQKRKPDKSKRRRNSNETDNSSSRQNPSQPQMWQQPQMQQVPYGAYPAGQFVPMMVGPNQFQPVAMAPPFPPPSYTEQNAEALPRSQVHPTDPPVYSYLVRRGYAPMDGQGSSAASTSGRRQKQEPELRLDSGVEYMRR